MAKYDQLFHNKPESFPTSTMAEAEIIFDKFCAFGEVSFDKAVFTCTVSESIQ